MIPKRIFQTSKEPLAPHIRQRVMKQCPGWKYEYFNDQDIVDFFRKNPLEDFPDVISRFHAIKTGQHRADLFRYYYLYIYGGVFLDSDAMIYTNIDCICQDYSFFTIQTHDCIRPHGKFSIIFQGFLGAAPNNDIIYMALDHIYHVPLTELESNYNLVCEKMFQIVHQCSHPYKWRLYYELFSHDMNFSVTHIDETDNTSDIILIHYWKDKVVPDDDIKWNDQYSPYIDDPQQMANIPGKIPKIIHQLWIGPKPRPSAMMETWKLKNPDCEYILWDEARIEEHVDKLGHCKEALAAMQEINGLADIYRWEILYHFGGVFIDADSICVESICDQDAPFFDRQAFATFENENVRHGLIATGTMGFVPKHPLLADILHYLKTDEEAIKSIRHYRAWFSVGPGLLTKMLDTKKYSQMITIFPSYMFLPHHFTGDRYRGYKKVYGYQVWGTGNNLYNDNIHKITLPHEFNQETFFTQLEQQGRMISVLVPSYNVPRNFVKDCLSSIRNQIYASDPIGIELVWINDGSDQEHSAILEEELMWFMNTTRLIRLNYHRLETNGGVANALRFGVEKCSYELIARMDADDIMVQDRLFVQYNYMMNHPGLALSGGAIQKFPIVEGNDTVKKHPAIIRYGSEESKRNWIANHPTFMMRKSAILSIGNYQDTMKDREDWELLQRVLEKYQEIHNMANVLVYYRIHPGQVTARMA